MPLPFIEEKALKRLERLLQKPRTVPELAKYLQVGERTIYRYIERLEADGAEISRKYRLAGPKTRPTVYQLQ